MTDSGRRGSPGGPDLIILVIASALLLIGLVMNLSASSVRSVASTGNAFTLFGRQLVWALLGMTALVVCSRVDYRRLRGWTYPAVPMTWALLVVTLLPGVGTEAYGAQRWIPIAGFSLQPSELAKLVLLLFGADVLSRKLPLIDDWRHVVTPFLVAVGVTALLILMQPDFGTMVIICGTAMLLVFLAGAQLRFLAVLTAIGVTVGVPAMLLEGYRRDRFMGFLHASRDARGAGWQLTQGLVGLGTGGLFGVGLGRSAQKWFYLPNAHTDFIFAIIGEETGLAGTLTVLLLFGLLAVFGIRAARQAHDAFGSLLAAGVTAWICAQAVVNVGAVAGLMPITGVPLPLISAGGSALLFSLAGLGLLASVARHGARPEPAPQPTPPGRRLVAVPASGARRTQPVPRTAGPETDARPA